MRINEILFLEKCIKLKRNCIIIGEKGIGKTWLLKKLNGCYIEFPSCKSILEKLVKYNNIELPKNTRYFTINELYEIVKPLLENSIILIDDFHEISKHTARLLEKITKNGATIIATSEKERYMNLFKEKLNLKPLKKSEAREICKELMKPPIKLAIELTLVKSNGYPGKLIEIVRDWNIAVKNLEVNFLDERDILKFFKKVKPQIPERINLLPAEYLFLFGFSALIFKYYFWEKGDFKTGYLIAATGYIILLSFRLLKNK